MDCIIITQPHYKGKEYQDPFWYNGVVATLSHGSNSISISAVGDIMLYLAEDRQIYGPEDLTAEELSLGDKFLNDLVPAEAWFNNNWFEMEVFVNGKRVPVELGPEEVYFHLEEAIEQAKTMLEDSDWWEELNEYCR